MNADQKLKYYYDKYKEFQDKNNDVFLPFGNLAKMGYRDPALNTPQEIFNTLIEIAWISQVYQLPLKKSLVTDSLRYVINSEDRAKDIANCMFRDMNPLITDKIDDAYDEESAKAGRKYLEGRGAKFDFDYPLKRKLKQASEREETIDKMLEKVGYSKMQRKAALLKEIQAAHLEAIVKGK